MRQAFAHDAVLSMPPDADLAAPGAAITVALCGHWEHEPPCPLAPHHTGVTRVGDEVRVRVLFATEPDRESEVRERIERALRGAALEGPDGNLTRWRLDDCRAGVVSCDEAAHAGRLVASE